MEQVRSYVPALRLTEQPIWWQYACALGIAALCILARLALDPLLGVQAPYATFYLGIMACSLLFTMGPSVGVLVLGGLFGRLLTQERSTQQVAGLVNFWLYIAVGLVMIVLTNRLRQAVANAEHSANEAVARQKMLEQQVRLREEAQQKLRNTMLDLQRSNKELEDFAFVASHDLQEPLRKLHSFSDRLLTRHAGELSEEAKDYTGRVQHAATRMQTLIDDLLSLSRVSSRNEKLKLVDLGEVVKVVLEDLEEVVRETHAQIEVGALPSIEAQASHMRQLFTNLLSNALKFHKPGEPPRVSVSAEPLQFAAQGEPLGYEISIQDHGIGFDEKYADRVFAIFQRLHGKSDYEGSGIGLAICRKIVERHHGSIKARSAEGEGTTFVVRLPTRQPTADTDAEQT